MPTLRNYPIRRISEIYPWVKSISIDFEAVHHSFSTLIHKGTIRLLPDFPAECYLSCPNKECTAEAIDLWPDIDHAIRRRLPSLAVEDRRCLGSEAKDHPCQTCGTRYRYCITPCYNPLDPQD